MENLEEDSPLLKAVYTKSVAEVESVLRSTGQKYLHVSDYSSMTPLAHAVQSNLPEMVQVLVQDDAGSDGALFMPAEDGAAPMVIAARWGYIEVMQILYRANPEVLTYQPGRLDCLKSRYHPLEVAAEGGQFKAVKWILELGISPNQPDQYGSMPLHLAAESESVETIRVLIQYGAKIDGLDGEKMTPLHRAIWHASTLGLNWDQFDSLSQKRFQCVNTLIAAGPEMIDLPDKSGNTPLYLSIYTYDPYIAVAILRWSTQSLDVPGSRELTPIQLAIERTRLYTQHRAIDGNLDDDLRRRVAKMEIFRLKASIQILKLLLSIHGSAIQPPIDIPIPTEEERLAWRHEVYFDLSLTERLIRKL